MNKAVHRIAGYIMAFILAMGTTLPGKAASQSALMPDEIINIVHFYKPPRNMTAATAIENFNSIILTNGDQTYLNALQEAGFAHTIPQYFRAEAIQDPGTCSAEPLNNQVAYKPGDFCDISSNHPDWFLLDENGKRLKVLDSRNYYRMDPASPGWREFFLERVLESQEQYGWSGLFLDNLEASLGKFSTVLPAKYSTDESYQDAVAGFLKYLDDNYANKHKRIMIGNIITRRDDDVWFRYLQYLDGAMQERFAVNWNEKAYLKESAWLEDLELMEETQSRGKYVILVAPGFRANTRRQTFAFASYLLISNGKAAFRYSTDDAYRQVWLYKNYKIDLGSPLGPRYQDGDSWRRDFTNGTVVVNPIKRTATIKTGTVSAPATPTGPQAVVYNDRNSAFTYTGTWTNVANAKSMMGQFRVTLVMESSATLHFQGRSFTVVYKTGPTFGNMDVYVDGEHVGTIDQKTGSQQFQQKWEYNGPSDGSHELKLVFSGPEGTRVSLDAVTVP